MLNCSEMNPVSKHTLDYFQHFLSKSENNPESQDFFQIVYDALLVLFEVTYLSYYKTYCVKMLAYVSPVIKASKLSINSITVMKKMLISTILWKLQSKLHWDLCL